MPEPEIASLAADWLASSDEDLRVARAGLTQRTVFVPRHSCYYAQQAAEKAIKAVCIGSQIEFAYIHDLPRLAAALPESARPSATTANLVWLTRWATVMRYPGEAEARWPDAERAVEIATTVIADARASLGDS